MKFLNSEHQNTPIWIYLMPYLRTNQKLEKPEIAFWSQTGSKVDVGMDLFSDTETQSLIILIPNLGMLTPRGHRKLVHRFLAQNALQRHHVTACTSYYYCCAQFLMHIPKIYTVYIENFFPKTL